GPCRRATSRTTTTASTTRADELNPLPSVLVVHVEPADGGRGRRIRVCRTATPNDDVLSIGRPRRLGGRDVQVREHRPRIASVRVHQPEVVLSAPVGDEGDRLAVGGDTRLKVQGDATVLCQRL